MIKLAKLLKSAVVVSIAALSLTACKEEAKDYSGVYVRQEGDFTYIKELEKTQKENNYIERFIAKRSNGTPTGDNSTRTVKIEMVKSMSFQDILERKSPTPLIHKSIMAMFIPN